MVFDESKRDMVESRLRSRLREHTGSVGDYLVRIRRDPEVWRGFLDEFTVNETYFFRDLAQMEAFAETAEAVARAKAQLPYGKVRIWSAGCSIGCEPYSLAIVMQETVERHGLRLDWSVLGTDISPSALEVARSALYSDREVRDVRPEWRAKYFARTGTFWEFVHPCRRNVQFRYSNLLSPGPEASGPFDIIFCRNVLIYFDAAARRQAARELARRLEPGGHLFLGAGESLRDAATDLDLCRARSGFVYVRPRDGSRR